MLSESEVPTMGQRRGFFATIAYEAEKAERAERRHQRELLARARAEHRAFQQAQKEAAIQQAEYEVEVFQNHMEVLLSVHHEVSPFVNWVTIKESPAPIPPAMDVTASTAAKAAIDAYKPTFFERLLGLRGRRQQFEASLRAAQDAEKEKHLRAQREHDEAFLRWKEEVAFAESVLAGSTVAYSRALDDSGCLDELEELGCSGKVSWINRHLGHVELRVRGPDVVPKEEKSMTARGKLTTKKMATGRSWETYQDFLCGSALRAARELLAILPIHGVLVDVFAPMLNSANGQIQESVVLSVFFPREGMRGINFEKADPSDAVSTFKHSMSFSRGKGIAPVIPIDPHEIAA